MIIAADLTKQEFVLQVLERDILNIYRAQLTIAEQNIYFEGKDLKMKVGKKAEIGSRSGALLVSLRYPDYLIQAQGEEIIVSSGIVKHMRFIDIKKYGNRKIYNRQVWGILYNNALPSIKYGFGKELYDFVGEKLREAFEYKKNQQGQ